MDRQARSRPPRPTRRNSPRPGCFRWQASASSSDVWVPQHEGQLIACPPGLPARMGNRRRAPSEPPVARGLQSGAAFCRALHSSEPEDHDTFEGLHQPRQRGVVDSLPESLSPLHARARPRGDGLCLRGHPPCAGGSPPRLTTGRGSSPLGRPRRDWSPPCTGRTSTFKLCEYTRGLGATCTR